MIMATMGVGVEWLDVVVWMALLMMCACVPLRFVRQIYSSNWQCQRDKQTVRDIYANCQMRKYTQSDVCHISMLSIDSTCMNIRLCAVELKWKLFLGFFRIFEYASSFKNIPASRFDATKDQKYLRFEKSKCEFFF